MGDPEPPEFGSLEDELEYWKEQAARHQQRCVPLVYVVSNRPESVSLILHVSSST